MARPKEFDPAEALDNAMHQFWAKGYHDTSIRDLVARTGVNYYGLYEVFDNKHGLFLASLDRYRETVTALVIGELKRPGPVKPALRRTFNRLLGLLKTNEGRVGCMMCNTAIELAPYDKEAADRVQGHMSLLRGAFKSRLEEGQRAGEIEGSADLGALAEFLTSTAYTIGILLRTGCSDAHIKRHLDTALSAI